MKYICVVFLGLLACSYADKEEGHGGKGRRHNKEEFLKELFKKEVCKCDTIKGCLDEKKALIVGCATSEECKAKLGAESPFKPMEIKQCFEKMKETHIAMKECMDGKIGKRCQEGESEDTGPDLEELLADKAARKGKQGGKRRHGKGKGKGKGKCPMRQLKKQLKENMPEAMHDYKKCVMKCVHKDVVGFKGGEGHGGGHPGGGKGGKSGGKGHKGRKGRKRGHHGKGKGKGRMLVKLCMKENECRPIFHLHEEKKEAMKACKEEVKIDKLAKVTEMCECLKGAGMSALDCKFEVEPETGTEPEASRRRRFAPVDVQVDDEEEITEEDTNCVDGFGEECNDVDGFGGIFQDEEEGTVLIPF